MEREMTMTRRDAVAGMTALGIVGIPTSGNILHRITTCENNWNMLPANLDEKIKDAVSQAKNTMVGSTGRRNSLSVRLGTHME